MTILKLHASRPDGHLIAPDGGHVNLTRNARVVDIDTAKILAVTNYYAEDHIIGGKPETRHIRQVITTDGTFMVAAASASRRDIPESIRTLDSLGGKARVTVARTLDYFMTSQVFSGLFANPVTISIEAEDLAHISRGHLETRQSCAAGIDGMFTKTGQNESLAHGTDVHGAVFCIGNERFTGVHLDKTRLEKFPSPDLAGGLRPGAQARALTHA